MKISTKHSFGAAVFTALSFSTPYIQALEVELLESFNISMSHYGQSSESESFSVAVDNLSPEKSVFLVREKTDGSWVDIPMYFHASSGDGKEIWKLNQSSSDFADEFVVRMEANGASYWDNNSGVNYTVESEGYLLGSQATVVVAGSYSYDLGNGQSRQTSIIVVDNLGPTKSIELVYSFDGWATSHTAQAYYDGSRPIVGYGSYPNPSANNAESWTSRFEFSSELSGEYYIKYSVNGVDYYDSNYGVNYPINPQTNFPSMHLRQAPGWSTGFPMEKVDTNIWAANVFVTDLSSAEIKFDVFNDWSVNYGDTDSNGTAEQNGNNIELPIDSGSYRVLFNDLTLKYSIQAFGL